MHNPPPVQSSVDVEGKRVTAIWVQWFSALYSFILRLIDYSAASIQSPISGFVITVSDGTLVLTINPSGTLATGSITTPPNPVDGQPLEVSTTQTITSLTVSANAGQTIKNPPTTLSAGSGFAYYYNALSSTWFRRY